MILALIDAGCRIRDTILRITYGTECPVCSERTHHQAAHHHVNHSTGGL